MYQSLHTCVVVLFERFFTDELSIPAQAPCLTFHPHPRIQVDVYDDIFCHLALFTVDGRIVLKENMIENLQEYYHRTTTDRNFHAFLIEFVNP